MKHSRKDYNGVQDATNHIPEDEPVFLLRGQDILAAATVRFWANQLARLNGDPKLVLKANEHADLMNKWIPSKLPDDVGEDDVDS
jgi:hypothetical protein